MNNVYQKSILHCHYSGIVRNTTILNYLMENEIVSINSKNNVYFSNNPTTPPEELKKIIKNVFSTQSDDDRFKIIGNLWYYIIKDVYFFKKYNSLIISEMKFQNVKYIEFRIKLGSHFYVKKSSNSNDRHSKMVSIEDELLLFYKIRKLYEKNNTSFKIICQISKSSTPTAVYRYFSEILRILNKYPHLKEIVRGFDITGDEIHGHSLSYFKEVVERLQSLYKDTILPFFFHAGECDHPKSIDNIKFALLYGGNRIGHGIYCIRNKKILNKIKEKKILLEIAPLSNLYLNNLKDPFIFYKLYKLGIQMSINTDDPNKLHDSSLQENEMFLLNHGFNQKQIDDLHANALNY